MKFLQLKKTTNNQPRILEMGKHFQLLNENSIMYLKSQMPYTNQGVPLDCEIHKPIEDYLVKGNKKFRIEAELICKVSDCYQSRPLIELEYCCEFDVIVPFKNVTGEYLNYDSGVKEAFCYFRHRGFILMGANHHDMDFWDKFYKHYVNKGSIFTPKNQTKYPELYKQVLEIINPN